MHFYQTEAFRWLKNPTIDFLDLSIHDGNAAIKSFSYAKTQTESNIDRNNVRSHYDRKNISVRLVFLLF